MRVRNHKKMNVIKYLTFVLIIAVLALSFYPCNYISQYSGPWSDKITQTSNYVGFEPEFYVVVTIIELLLLFISNKTWSKVVRFILNLIKISLPVCAFYFMEMYDEIFYDVGGYSAHVGWSAYVIVGIGFVIGAVEIIDILSAAKEKSDGNL